jgi:DTW domain-containing protein YfiP
MLVAETSASITSGTETTLLSWSSDGTKKVGGFIVRGPVEAEVRLYFGSTKQLTYLLTNPDRNAYFVFPKSELVASGTTVYIKIYQTSGASQTFYGSLLEGN